MHMLINSCKHHLLEFSDSFYHRLSPRISRVDYAIAGAILLFSLTVFLWLAPDAILGGDAVVYAQQIDQAQFSVRTMHLGYYLLGTLFKPFLSFDADYSINAMSCVFGALCLSLLFLISRVVFGDRQSGVVSCALLFTNYCFLFNCVFAEVYIVQVFFILLSLMMWLQRRSSLAGLFLAVGFLVSPSALFIVPGMILLRPRVKSILALTLWPLAAAVVLVLFHEQDYLYGARGVLAASGYSIPWIEILAKETRELFVGSPLALPLMVIGVLGVARGKLRPFFFLLALTFLVIFLVGERTSEIPAQLVTMALLHLCAGFGFVRLLRREAEEDNRDLCWVFFGSLGLAAVYGISVKLAGGLIAVNLLAAYAVYLLIFLMVVAVARRTAVGNSRLSRLALCLLLLAAVAGNGVKANVDLRRAIHRTVDFKRRVLLMDKASSPDCLVVASWGKGVLYERYASAPLDTRRWIDARSLVGSIPDRQREVPIRNRTMRQAMAEEREIWLFGRYPPVIGLLEDEGYDVSSLYGFHRAAKN